MEFDEKGKFFTEVIRKKPVRVYLQTTQQLILGNVHVRLETRLKDEIDQAEPSLALTDAVVFGSEGQILYQAKFLVVSTKHIVWMIPEDELIEASEE